MALEIIFPLRGEGHGTARCRTQTLVRKGCSRNLILQSDALREARARYRRHPPPLRRPGPGPGRRLSAAQPWPTGLPAVDRLSSIGGLPRGRITVLQGAVGSGKMSLAEHAHVVVIDQLLFH